MGGEAHTKDLFIAVGKVLCIARDQERGFVPGRRPDHGVRQADTSGASNLGCLPGNGPRQLNDLEVAEKHLGHLGLFFVAHAPLDFYPRHPADQTLTMAKPSSAMSRPFRAGDPFPAAPLIQGFDLTGWQVHDRSHASS